MTDRREIEQMGGIKRVKKIREDKAQRQVSTARNEVDRRQSVLRRSKQSLETFKNSKSDRSNSLFRAIQGKSISLKEIQRYNGALAALEEEQNDLSKKVDEARSGVSVAERTLVEARDHYKVQVKNHTKINEVHQHLKGEFKVREAKREEKSVEDDFVYKSNKK